MTTESELQDLLTYREAAALLKISSRTLERWTSEGLVPYIRLPQRGTWSGIRFSRSQLQQWLRQRTVKPR
jgi:excisionase family DNA binding protein